jgi:photosystem II stability/assembly factor-like uncharacterized protein
MSNGNGKSNGRLISNAGTDAEAREIDRGYSMEYDQVTVSTVKPAPVKVRKHKTGKTREKEHNAPYDRLHWFMDPRVYPGKEIPEKAVLNAFLDAEKLRQAELLEIPSIQMASPTRWQLLGPGNFSGRVNAIAVDRNNTQRIYACTSSGGIWRSSDGGTSWADINLGLGSNFTSAVTIDPGNSNVVYVSTGDHNTGMTGAGLFKSTNLGNSFVVTGLNFIRWASRIIVHPTNSSVLYVASDSGVYKSLDAAATWSRVQSGAITDLVIHPTNPNILYSAVWGSGIYKTTDGGATWTLQTASPSASFSRIRLALCTNFPDTLYASFDVAGKVDIRKTTNGGTTWTQLPDPPDAGWGQLWYNHYIAVKPNDPNVVYTGQGTIFRTLNGGAGGGVGAGKAWREIHEPIGANYSYIHVDHHCLTFDPVNPNTIYCGCDGGVYRSRFGGNYWEYIGASIPSSEFYAMGQAVQEPYLVGGGTQDNGTWLTDGNYNRWQHILGGDGFYFVVDPTNPNIVYAEWQFLNLNRSDNKGRTFARKMNGIMEADPKPWMGRIELDQSNPATLYVGTDRVYKTTNRMDNWTLLRCGDNVVLISPTKGESSLIRINAESTAAAALGLSGESRGTNDSNGNPQTFARMLSTMRAPFALTHGMTLRIRLDNHAEQTVTFRNTDFANIGAATAREVAQVIDAQTTNLHAGTSAASEFSALRVAPSSSNTIYAASRNQIWKSTNGGSTWRSVRTATIPDRWITDLDVVATNANQVYMSVSGFGTPHVYYSGNGGTTWEARSTGLPDTPASTIVVDPTNPLRVWVGTDMGVYVSQNGGVSWTLYNQGIPRVVITDLKFHRNLGLLRASTYGRGVWERQATDPTLQISGIRTASQSSGNQDSFRLTQDALTLVIDVSATQDLLNLGLRFDAIYQIIDSRTNRVVRQASMANTAFSWGRFFWISQGNNWGPAPGDYTTPQKWGLGVGTYIFRALMSVRDTNTFAVSQRKWFRVI